MRTVVNFDLAQGKKVEIYSEDDVEEILEWNKHLRATEQKGDWGRHVATIPDIVMVTWLNESWQSGHNIRYLSKEWGELIRRKLQDPDWAYLRTDGPRYRVGWS